MYYVRTGMKKLLFSIGFLVRLRSLGSPCALAQQPAAAASQGAGVLHRGGRARSLSVRAAGDAAPSGARAGEGGYAFAATSDWDALNDAKLQDVRVVIWLNDMPHTPAQRQAFDRYMAGGGAWLGFHVSGFGSNAWPWFTEFLGGAGFSASNWPSLPARVNVDDVKHPIVESVPPTFVAPTTSGTRGRRALAPTRT